MSGVLHALEGHVRPEHTGLLVTDPQNGFLHADGEMSGKRGTTARSVGPSCRA